MKNMYIRLIASYCLIATCTHAAENQGKSYSEAAKRGLIVRRYVSTIGQIKPEIFPHTDHSLFQHGQSSKQPYQKNTVSHPTSSHKISINPHIADELAPLFEPKPILLLEDAPKIQSIPAPENIAILLASPLATTQIASLATPSPDEQTSRLESPFNPMQHAPIYALTTTWPIGYGMTIPAAVCLAIKKDHAPKSALRVKMQDPKKELNAALKNLQQAAPEEAETILQYAATQAAEILEPQALSSAALAMKSAELATLTAMDPAIQAARTQAARVKAAQDALAKESAALLSAQEKVLAGVPEAKKSSSRTNLVFKMMGSELPETSAFSTDLPAHEIIAADIQARKAALTAKPVCTTSTTTKLA